MNNPLTQPPLSAQQGVAIVEALVAILIFSIGVLGVVGMQASMLKNTAESKYRTDAANLAQRTIGRMWTDPANLLTYVTTTSVDDDLPNGTMVIVQPSLNQFVLTIRWQQPGELPHSYSATAYINGVIN